MILVVLPHILGEDASRDPYNTHDHQLWCMAILIGILQLQYA